MTATMHTKTLPLAGLRILALEQYGAGPYASMYLADLGAEVIKIETPLTGGDVARGTGPCNLGATDSLFFQFFNQNKRSLALDIKSDSGRAAFERLVATADVVMNNLRGDLPERLRITYGHLQSIKPSIICAHLSAYGRHTERASWPGYDYLMQAEAGFMHMTGEPEGAPTRFGLSVVDFLTGLATSVAILAGAWAASRTGTGCDVDVSLFDVAMHQLSYPGMYYLNDGLVTRRAEASGHPSVVPCQTYPTRDGSIFIMAMSQGFWEKLIQQIDEPQAGDGTRFGTLKLRQKNKAELNTLLSSAFSRRTTAHWIETLAGEVPIAPINSLESALDNPYFERDGGIQRYAHAGRGELRTISNPIRVGGKRLLCRGAPLLGQDTETLLREIGLGPDEIRQMQADGVILAPQVADATKENSFET